jgi:3-mercaptopyruvate sulfurtransferase SseA
MCCCTAADHCSRVQKLQFTAAGRALLPTAAGLAFVLKTPGAAAGCIVIAYNSSRSCTAGYALLLLHWCGSQQKLLHWWCCRWSQPQLLHCCSIEGFTAAAPALLVLH